MSQLVDHTLIFLHIPKAGGSTLNHIVDWNYKHVYKMQYYHQIPTFVALSDSEKRRYDCVRDGFFVGIDQYLPQQTTYITMLRQPVERFLSAYYYTMARRKREGLPNPDSSIEQFLAQEPFQAHMQLSLLRGGDTIDEALHTPLGPDALETAQRHVETRFAVAGVLDYYDESLILMKQALGWSRAYYARRNVNRDRPQAQDLSPDVRRLVETACEPEFELYDWAKKRLEAVLAQQGDDFQAELARLRQANRRFETLYTLTAPLQNTPVWKLARRTARQLLSGKTEPS